MKSFVNKLILNITSDENENEDAKDILEKINKIKKELYKVNKNFNNLLKCPARCVFSSKYGSLFFRRKLKPWYDIKVNKKTNYKTIGLGALYFALILPINFKK